MFATGYNTTDGPVVIDNAGRVLAGGEFGPVDTAQQTVQDAVDAGRLVLPDAQPGRGSSDGAVDAAAAAEQLQGRADAFRAADKKVLVKLATGLHVAGEPGEDGVPHKADLVSALAYSDVQLPTATSTTPPAAPAPKES